MTANVCNDVLKVLKLAGYKKPKKRWKRPHKKGSGATAKLYFRIKKLDAKQQIAYGEVYAPYTIDSHGDMMVPEDIQLLAHRFMEQSLNNHIDVMHNNKPANAVAVESFIARESDPDYMPGAWVMGTKFYDKDLWEDVEAGIYNGYSFEALVYKEEVEVELSVIRTAYIATEEKDGHFHYAVVEVDDDGKVAGGRTSVVNNHFHEIKAGTATELDEDDDHGHRFFLP